MANDLKFGNNARIEIAKGIKTLADAVKVTLGPRGRNVIIEQEFGTPLIINDGVTIAKNVVLENQYQNLGASLIIEAASKTNDLAGDGTTTAVILSSSCILNGLENFPYKNTYAWIISNAKKYEKPIPYKHPMGAVIWVNIVSN